MNFKVNVNGVEDANRRINYIFDRTKDFRPLFEVLQSDFYKTEKNMVFVARPGKYADLMPRTKIQKMRQVGQIYPVLVWSWLLKESLTKRNSKDNITTIKEKSMVLGTKLKYAEYLFRGTSKMKKRPPIIVDLFESRWKRSIKTYYSKVVEGH